MLYEFLLQSNSCNDYKDFTSTFQTQYKTSPQAKRHKLSVLITSLTNFTSLAFKTLINFYHWITFITRSIYCYSYYRLKRFRTLSSHFKLCLRSGLEAAPCHASRTKRPQRRAAKIYQTFENINLCFCLKAHFLSVLSDDSRSTIF